MDFMLQLYSTFKEYSLLPWFTIADTDINLIRLIGLLIILLIVWRAGILFEKLITRIGSDQNSGTSPGWYALSRISRYAIWIIGLLVGLSYFGFNMASFALIGGAIGVGVGFGLQNIFNNFSLRHHHSD